MGLAPVSADIAVDYKLVAVAAVVIVGLYIYFKKEIKEGAQAVGAAINPVDPNNIFNKSVTAVYSEVTGSADPGGDFYDTYHTDDGDINVPWFNPMYAVILATDKVTGMDQLYTENEQARSQALN